MLMAQTWYPEISRWSMVGVRCVIARPRPGLAVKGGFFPLPFICFWLDCVLDRSRSALHAIAATRCPRCAERCAGAAPEPKRRGRPPETKNKPKQDVPTEPAAPKRKPKLHLRPGGGTTSRGTGGGTTSGGTTG